MGGDGIRRFVDRIEPHGPRAQGFDNPLRSGKPGPRRDVDQCRHGDRPAPRARDYQRCETARRGGAVPLAGATLAGAASPMAGLYAAGQHYQEPVVRPTDIHGGGNIGRSERQRIKHVGLLADQLLTMKSGTDAGPRTWHR
ncbi:hypothetical protein [Sphingomonas sp.]|uniref:hypothetical protein n=1 Tax=Sphingomonas sp. TaxID=28214 RepID=UPI003AFFB3DD